MILSGKEIQRQVNLGHIRIDPFDERFVNPNSYNLRLHNELMVYTDPVLDMKKEPGTMRLAIPESGLLLDPGRLYLGRTHEYTETGKFVPMLEGRSSVGRLGLYVHVTAGFGDIGFSGYWTLEIQCIQPIVIYPMIDICQIYYHRIEGDYALYHSGKYQKNQDIQPSLIYQDFE